MKKHKEIRFRHRIIIFLAKILCYPFLVLKNKFSYKKMKIKKNEQYLILCNHTLAIDPLLISYLFNRNLYFVGSEQLFNLGLLSKLLIFSTNLISKTKSLSDVSTIKKMKKITNEGGSVCLFAEGNLTFNGSTSYINISLVKLVKFLNIPVLIVNSQGLYFSNPRWSLSRKHGETSMSIKKIIFPSEYNEYSNDELYSILINELDVNAYKQNKTLSYTYTGKNMAKGLENFAVICPKCKSVHSFVSNKNTIECKFCHNRYEYNEYGYLVNESTIDLVSFDNQQKIDLIETLKINNISDYNIINDVLVKDCKKTKKIKLGYKKLMLSNKGIILNDELIEYCNIINLAIQGKNKLICYVNDKTLMFEFDEDGSPYLYLLVFQYYKNNFDNKANINVNLLGLR